MTPLIGPGHKVQGTTPERTPVPPRQSKASYHGGVFRTPVLYPFPR